MLVHITPGDPLVAILPADASQELAAQLRTAYGFDRPLPVQFGLWLWRARPAGPGDFLPPRRPVLFVVLPSGRKPVPPSSCPAPVRFSPRRSLRPLARP